MASAWAPWASPSTALAGCAGQEKAHGAQICSASAESSLRSVSLGVGGQDRILPWTNAILGSVSRVGGGSKRDRRETPERTPFFLCPWVPSGVLGTGLGFLSRESHMSIW